MTKEATLARIDLLSGWAATSLRAAIKYDAKDWGAPIAATCRANAGCYNECAGLIAADDLGIACLLIDRDRLALTFTSHILGRAA
jgi:hypothetical protein